MPMSFDKPWRHKARQRKRALSEPQDLIGSSNYEKIYGTRILSDRCLRKTTQISKAIINCDNIEKIDRANKCKRRAKPH